MNALSADRFLRELAADSPSARGGLNLSEKLDIMPHCKSPGARRRATQRVGNDNVYYVPFAATRIHRKLTIAYDPAGRTIRDGCGFLEKRGGSRLEAC